MPQRRPCESSPCHLSRHPPIRSIRGCRHSHGRRDPHHPERVTRTDPTRSTRPQQRPPIYSVPARPGGLLLSIGLDTACRSNHTHALLRSPDRTVPGRRRPLFRSMHEEQDVRREHPRSNSSTRALSVPAPGRATCVGGALADTARPARGDRRYPARRQRFRTHARRSPARHLGHRPARFSKKLGPEWAPGRSRRRTPARNPVKKGPQTRALHDG
jgi:hypothetical protein